MNNIITCFGSWVPIAPITERTGSLRHPPLQWRYVPNTAAKSLPPRGLERRSWCRSSCRPQHSQNLVTRNPAPERDQFVEKPRAVCRTDPRRWQNDQQHRRAGKESIMIGNNFKVRFCLCLSPASQFDSTFGYLPPPLFGHRSRRRGWPRRRARGSRQAAGAGSLTRRNSLGICCLEKKSIPSIHTKFGSTLLLMIS